MRILLNELNSVPPPHAPTDDPHGDDDEGQREDEDLHLDVEVPRVREAPVLAPRRRQVVDVQHVLPEVGSARPAKIELLDSAKCGS